MLPHGRRRRPWSTLGFAEQSAVYKRPTQNARVLSDGWVGAHAFCPGCGTTPLTAFAANSPMADFHCGVCARGVRAQGSQGPRTDSKRVNGAWSAMKARLAAASHPSLMVMGYDKARTLSLSFRHSGRTGEASQTPNTAPSDQVGG